MPSIEGFRAELDDEAGCQIVRYSILPRGLARPWLIARAGNPVGYAGVWTKHWPNRIMELYLEPDERNAMQEVIAAVVQVTGASAIEAQTNMALMMAAFHATDATPVVENLLFEDGTAAGPVRPDLFFRARQKDDEGPEGDWVVVSRETVVAAGGLLTHYNFPYQDLYFEVVPDQRGQGIGKLLVGKLREMCRARGGIPAARCDPTNEASRRALLGGGMVACGEIVSGEISSTARRSG